MNHLLSKLVYLNMQRKQISNFFRMLILQVLHLNQNLATLKTEADKLDIDKLATSPVDLSKLSDVVKK